MEQSFTRPKSYNIFMEEEVEGRPWPIESLFYLFARQWRAYQKRVALGCSRKLVEVHPAFTVRVYKGHEKRGVVYVVRVSEGLFKIGRTVDIRRRVRGLNCGRVDNVEIIHTIPSKTPVADEQAMHLRFKAYHVKNELFALTDDVLAEIKGITAFPLP